MKFTAVFTSPALGALIMNEAEKTFDVTPEISALGGAIPRADSNGTDLLQYATHAPDWIKEWRGPFTIEVRTE